MPRKFTLEQRKRMLERLEHGATHSDLKAEFGIRDGRTLEKQLRQARQEQVLMVARTEVIKESLRDHLGEVRSLIESWGRGIKAPSLPSFSRLPLSRYPLSASEEMEHSRLFEGMRQHLPFSELWKDYQAFKEKFDGYLTICEELHRQVLQKAKRDWGLSLLEKEGQRPGLTVSFSWETLDRAIKIAMGDELAGMPRYDARPLDVKAPLEYLMCDSGIILYSNEALRYADSHRSMIAEWAQSDKVAAYVKLLGELRNLEQRIQVIVEEALLRRDYVLYSCRLCPGEGKPAFK